MIEQIIETWHIHNRINLFLLEAIEKDEYLNDMLYSKGRNVGMQFSHMHNVRLMWFKEAIPELLVDLIKIEKAHNLTKELLKTHLVASSDAMETLLIKGFDEDRIKGFKPHPIAFLGYIISHESHHRGQIVLCLKQSGHPIGKKIGFGLWRWGTR